MTTDEVRALLALCEAALAPTMESYDALDVLQEAATPTVVAALCTRVIELEESACDLPEHLDYEAVEVRAEMAETDAGALAVAIRDLFDAQRLHEHIRTDEEYDDANRAERAALDRLHALVYETVECVTCEGPCSVGDPTPARGRTTAAHFRFDVTHARSDSPRLLEAELPDARP